MAPRHSLYTLHSTLYTLHSTLYTVQCSVPVTSSDCTVLIPALTAGLANESKGAEPSAVIVASLYRQEEAAYT